MSEIISVHDQYYILASSVLSDEQKWILKDGDTFSICNRLGDIKPLGHGEQGIYQHGTRFLSRSEFRMAGQKPLLLSSSITDDNLLLTVDLTNPDFYMADGTLVPRGTLHIFRTRFFWKEVCYEKIKIWNLGLEPVEGDIALFVDSDFRDIFEVRGTRRERRGERRKNEVQESALVLSYLGLDGVERSTRIEASPKPATLTEAEIGFRFSLARGGQATFLLSTSCIENGTAARPLVFDHAYKESEQLRAETAGQYCQIESSNEQFDAWIQRSLSDLQMMVTQTPHGSYPYAGVPWFSTPFGRDGIITAFETLWVNPDLARGVLKFLAENQARDTDDARDSEPGKILHEARDGEMAALREIPFGLYYGSVDSTPLFVILAGAYYERTGDKAFLKSIWDNILLALEWIEKYGDEDGDGFVEYARHSPTGLVQQGWKDSDDSIFHADGPIAHGPIALCEVQGYVYAAKLKAAELAAALGFAEEAARWKRKAEELRVKFEAAFWCEDLSTYAIALDGDKKPCRIRSSNAGQCLFGGIASPERAERVVRNMMSHEFFSGWGIRTIASSEIRYNPMSYHNGSIWPHDNALITYGMGLYRHKDACLKVLSGIFEATTYFPLQRLPELFCGFSKRPSEGPTLYPVACSPQAWASAAPFLMLQACLGLEINGSEGKVIFHQPVLPPFLQELRIKNLRIGKDAIDVSLQRRFMDVELAVSRRAGNIEASIRRVS